MLALLVVSATAASASAVEYWVSLRGPSGSEQQLEVFDLDSLIAKGADNKVWQHVFYCQNGTCSQVVSHYVGFRCADKGSVALQHVKYDPATLRVQLSGAVTRAYEAVLPGSLGEEDLSFVCAARKKRPPKTGSTTVGNFVRMAGKTIHDLGAIASEATSHSAEVLGGPNGSDVSSELQKPDNK